jgi:hypothetical protein
MHRDSQSLVEHTGTQKNQTRRQEQLQYVNGKIRMLAQSNRQADESICAINALSNPQSIKKHTVLACQRGRSGSALPHQ